MTRVRLASADEADAIARIQIAAWRAAYPGLVPQDFLDSLDPADRAARWRTRLGPAAEPSSPTFVALDETDAIRGFARTGPLRDDDIPCHGRAEVYTMYVDPATWRRGFGARLMAAVEDFWRPAPVLELVLWAFEENLPARAFYERLGYAVDGTRKIDDFGGTPIAEVRFRRPMR